MKVLVNLLLCLFLITAAGCGSDDAADRSPTYDENTGSPDAASPDAAPSGPESMAEAMGQMFGGEGRSVETVDFRTLRDLLPEELNGMERVDASGEKTGMAGFSFSAAEGDYRSEDGERRVSLQITDGGGIGQMAMLGASWMQMDFDRESSEGYERTTDYEGYPAMEKLRTGDRPRSELQFVVADRFFVSAEGQNVEMDELKDAVDEIDLGELEDLRDEGVER